MRAPVELKRAIKPAGESRIKPRSARTGIFRRIAVERYMRPLEADTPALPTPWERFLAHRHKASSGYSLFQIRYEPGENEDRAGRIELIG